VRKGRPTKLTPERAARLIALLCAGATVTDAAAATGVDRRTIQLWRARAYSRDPGDERCVAFERDLRDALRAALTAARAVPEPADEWRGHAARLEAMYPQRWGPLGDVVELDDD
jgi:hypothetical protein